MSDTFYAGGRTFTVAEVQGLLQNRDLGRCFSTERLPGWRLENVVDGKVEFSLTRIEVWAMRHWLLAIGLRQLKYSSCGCGFWSGSMRYIIETGEK